MQSCPLECINNTNNTNRSKCYSSIVIEIGDGNIIWVWLGYWRVLVMGILFTFAILTITIAIIIYTYYNKKVFVFFDTSLPLKIYAIRYAIRGTITYGFA